MFFLLPCEHTTKPKFLFCDFKSLAEAYRERLVAVNGKRIRLPFKKHKLVQNIMIEITEKEMVAMKD